MFKYEPGLISAAIASILILSDAYCAHKVRVALCYKIESIVVVLRADSPGKAAQWFAESIRES
jgi:hypothetical protein